MNAMSETGGNIERRAGPRRRGGAGRRTRRERGRNERLVFLTRAIDVLASPLDETGLEEAARLAVPEIADACTIDLLLEDGRIERAVSLHVGPARGEVLQEISVPLEARGQKLGELGLYQTRDTGRKFSSWDLSVAKALAMRIALGIDNTRLLAAVQRTNAEMRRLLSATSHDLRNPLATMIAGVDFLRRTTGRETANLETRLEALGAIERSVRLQASLIGALLDRASGRASDRTFDQASDRAFEPASNQATDRRSDPGSESAPRPSLLPAEIGLLIVEDNRDTRKLLTYALRSLGYFAQAAESAEEALEFLRSEIEIGATETAASAPRRVVILADIGLPGLDGYEFLQTARAIRKERTRAIAVTARGSPNDVRRAREAGFDAHFVKPVDIHLLDRTIRDLATVASGEASRASGSAASSCLVPAASPSEPLS